jgi:hypothetical protein
MISKSIEIEERTGYRVADDGVLVNAPCCCFGETHHGHPYCAEPTPELLAAERDGLIYRSLDTGWQWHAA